MKLLFLCLFVCLFGPMGYITNCISSLANQFVVFDLLYCILEITFHSYWLVVKTGQ